MLSEAIANPYESARFRISPEGSKVWSRVAMKDAGPLWRYGLLFSAVTTAIVFLLHQYTPGFRFSMDTLLSEVDMLWELETAQVVFVGLMEYFLTAAEYAARIILLDVIILTLAGAFLWFKNGSRTSVPSSPVARNLERKLQLAQPVADVSPEISSMKDIQRWEEERSAPEVEQLAKKEELLDLQLPRTFSDSSSRSSHSAQNEGSTSSSSSSEADGEKHEIGDEHAGATAAEDSLAEAAEADLCSPRTGQLPSEGLDVHCAPCPSVLVQLPMYNERAVFARGIAAACRLDWPRDRLLVQVLDDSTEADISEGMKAEVAAWQARGLNVRYRHRTDRTGFKAGNLREGLKESYVEGYEYVAILDADFEPAPNWLRLSIPALAADPTLALVQTRWTFSNQDEGGLLTRLQAVELTWHFLAEQLVSSSALGTFGFNGTAGIWRTAAIADAGSWRDDTTVEDMDLAVCAVQRGWRMRLLPHVECLSEVPASYSAYRKQQKRWTAGPANLLRRRAADVLAAPASVLGWHAKAYVLGVYVLLRRSLRHLAGITFWLVALPMFFAFYPYSQQPPAGAFGGVSLCSSGDAGHVCSAAPAAEFTPASLSFWSLPWALFLLAVVHPLCLFAFDLKQLHLLPAYCCFHGALLPLRVAACLSGLLDLSSSHTWDVTLKMGRRSGSQAEAGGEESSPDEQEEEPSQQRPAQQRAPRTSRAEIFLPELAFGLFVAAVAVYACIRGAAAECTDLLLWIPAVGALGQSAWAVWAGLGGLGAHAG